MPPHLNRPPLKAIFFDLDGVLRHWDNLNLFTFEQQNNLPKGFLFQHAFQKPLLKKAVTGIITHEEWLDQIYESLIKEINSELSRDLLNTWAESHYTINEKLLIETRAQHPSVPFYMVTNATSRLDHDLQKTNLPIYFKHIFNTSEIGMAKPDKGLFRFVLERAGVEAGGSLFIDDLEENCVVAAGMGFWVINYSLHQNTASIYKPGTAAF
ncbi:MAG TPA: HAD-IA family hydrolase [Candidatus Paceibacterota bacterium]|nr:HAD-IA family hydrolase [Candidatus Paceibacterota bacterium]